MMESIRRNRGGGAVLALVVAGLMLTVAAGPGIASAASTKMDVRLYFLVDGKIAAATRSVDAGSMPATAALNALLASPAVNELAIGMRSALPAGLSTMAPLRLDSVTKTVTVSLPSIFTSTSASEEAQRTGQIVYTLTQFPAIQSVAFVIDGKPYKAMKGDGKRASGAVGRADFEKLVPAILVETAKPGNPLHVEGTANTFEAQFDYALYDAGNKKIASGFVTATSGTGTRGTFKTDISYAISKSQTGTLVAFEKSAKDGSTINLVAVPVALSSK